CPSLTDSGLSKVDAISPPVTRASRSMPSKSACSIEDASISKEFFRELIPCAIIFCTFSLIFCFSAASISATLDIESTQTRAPYVCNQNFGILNSLRLPNANFLVKYEPFIQKGVLKRSSRLFEMPSSSSSLSGSYTASPELPLIRCKRCNEVVVELVSKQQETMWRKFYRCIAKKTDGSQCDFFHWQASYAVLLIRDGFVSDDRCLELLMIALNDHGKAIESLTISIKDMRKKLSNLELGMEELDNVKKSMKAAMVEIEENKKSTAAALKLMENELQKLKGSTKVKPRNMALYFLLFGVDWVVCDGTDELGGGSIRPIYAEHS
ncbi:hypothetical protein U9M48_021506, partial [Paspalum notatum var. saurae]